MPLTLRQDGVNMRMKTWQWALQILGRILQEESVGKKLKAVSARIHKRHGRKRNSHG